MKIKRERKQGKKKSVASKVEPNETKVLYHMFTASGSWI